MPVRRTNITRKHTRGTDELTWDRVELLFTGIVYFPGDAPTFDSAEHARKVWTHHRAQLLQWWFNGVPAFEPITPGLYRFTGSRSHCRPCAWWKFDAPERRRILTVEEIHEADGRFTFTHRGATVADVARIWKNAEECARQVGERTPDDFGAPGILSGVGAFTVESESDYLARLDLLTDSERTAPASRLANHARAAIP